MRTGKKEVKGTLQAGNFTKVAEYYIGDPDGYTKLLAHFDGVNAGTAIVDSGNTGHIVTQVGTASLSTAYRKMGSGSCFFDGNSDYITVPSSPDWSFGTSDFTIDLWVNFTTHTTSQTIISQVVTSNDYWQLYRTSGGVMAFEAAVGGVTKASYQVSWTPTDKAWYHLALVRSGTNIYLFINGVLQTWTVYVAISTNAMPSVAVALSLGESIGWSQWFSGYIDEVRVSKGIARYTANFTPSTTPFTSDVYTKLLLHMEPHDVCGNIPTFVSTAKLSSNPIAKIGAGSLLLNGSTDYVTFPASSAWDLGTTYTVELWAYFSAVGATKGLIATYGTNTYGYQIDYHATNGIEMYQGGTSYFCAWTATAGQWYHIAVVGNGAAPVLYINGVSRGSFDGMHTLNAQSNSLAVGSMTSNTASNIFNGYIDEVRISKGVARYTANFIPQITEYTSDTYTKLLLHSDYNYVDASGARSGLSVGTAVISPAAKVGTYCGYFNGSAYLTAPDHADWDFGSSSFTVDFWVRFTSIRDNSDNIVICQGRTGSDYWYISLASSSGVRSWHLAAYITTAKVEFNKTTTVNLNQWYHIAVVRNGNDFYIFQDGVQVGTTVTDSDSFPTVSDVLTIGYFNAGNNFSGYLDEVRVSKGTARWTTGFTPQTTPYTSDANTQLLLHLDNNVTDSGNTVHTITNVSSLVTFVDAKIGTGALLLDGNSDYVTMPDSDDWNFGTGNFTVDFWVKFNSLSGDQGFGGTYQDSTHVYKFRRDSNGKITMIFKNGSTVGEYITTTAPTLSVGVWYHLAFARNATSAYIFLDGVPQTLTTTVAFSTNDLGNVSGVWDVGIERENAFYMNGYIDEFRISKGIARWTTDFSGSLPSTAYTTDSYTKLLMHFDTDMTDSSGTVFTGTGVGTAQVTSVSRFGSGSLLLDGNSDEVTYPDSDDWNFGANPFTVEAWIKFNSISGYQAVVGSRDEAGKVWMFYWDGPLKSMRLTASGGGISFDCGSNTISDVSAGVWYHVAATRVGNVFTVYFNGVPGSSPATDTNAMPNPGAVLDIGKYGSTGSYFNGYIDEVRISKGIARWTADFSASLPTTAYTADSYTKLLSHFDYDYMDSSTVGNPIGTGYNTAAISATQSKFGGSSLFLDGNSDYVTFPDSDNWNFGTGAMTIDFWLYLNGTGTQSFIGKRGVTGVGDWFLQYITGSSLLYMYINQGSLEFGCSWTPSTGQWYHIAVVRIDGGNTAASWMMCINGVSQTLTKTGSWNATWGNNALTLKVGSDRGDGNYTNGYIDELRISKGIARWTTNFTPPTSAYTTDWYTRLLCHFDTDFSDASGISHGAGTGVGTSQVTSPSRFGTNALLLNGSTDYITIPASNDWTFGDGNFTFECQVKFVDTAGAQLIYCIFGSGGDGRILYIGKAATTHKIYFYSYNGSVSAIVGQFVMTNNWSPSIGVWYHLAFVRNGASGLIFIDGVSQVVTVSNAFSTQPSFDQHWRIGVDYNYGSAFFNGYLDEMRISKGIARWTYDFQPPTVPYDLTVNAPATQLDFSNLNGNRDEEYLLVSRIISSSDSNPMYARLNNDSGSNYTTQYLNANSTNVAAPNSTYTGLVLQYNSPDTSTVLASELALYARSGYVRTAILRSADKASGTTVTGITTAGSVWNNAVDNITTLSVVSTNALGIGNLSSIELYAKREGV